MGNSGMKNTITENNRMKGHTAALVTILIWGTTFISTKVLLNDFQPVEILFFRFVLGFTALLIVRPRILKGTDLRQELAFAAPLFTAIMSQIFLAQEEKLKGRFFIGFAVSMAGIALISFNGSALELNPVGDVLALLAAFVWACYSVLTRKISEYGYDTILTTRRIFFYGILLMVPALFLFDFRFGPERFADPAALMNLLFLGLGASALCFVTWNSAVKYLGAVRTSVYIYMVPVITVVTSFLILHEPFTWMTAAGTVLTMAGLFLSQKKDRR